jgi:hypothetical protein
LFTLFFYTVYFAVIKKHRLIKQLIAISFISALLVLFVGFNPYITNTLDHKNPFYPLAGEGKMDIMTGNTPAVLQDKSRGKAVLVSLFSFPDNSSPSISDSPQYINKYASPSNLFSLSKKNIFQIGGSDTRTGGFGLFFTWILVLSVILYCHKSMQKQRMKYTVFLLLLFGSLFILPDGWWARYVPFFYAFPLIILLYSEHERSNMYIKWFKNTIYLLLIANIGLQICGAGSRAWVNKKEVDDYINVLSQSTSPIQVNFNGNVGFKIKLDKNKVKYEETLDSSGTELHSNPPLFLNSDQFEITDNKLIKK